MEILNQRKISAIPDIIANSGGVIASMEEYSKSLSALKVRKEEVFAIIEEKLNQTFVELLKLANSMNVTISEAVIQIALERVYRVMKNRRYI